MATVNGLKADYTLQILGESVNDAAVDGSGNLLLERRNGELINAGNVRGEKGDPATVQIATKLVTELPASYPMGISTFSITTGDAGWPSTVATIMTVRHAANRTIQLYTAKTSGITYIRAEHENTWGDWSKLATIGTDGNLTTDRVRILSTSDVSLTSTNHGLQIGPDTGAHLIMDNNEMMARNAGVASQIYSEGGWTSGVDPVVGNDVVRKSYFDSFVTPAEMPGSVDFNTKTLTGRWVQSSDAEAATAINAPTTRAGLLEVFCNAAINMIWQRYTPYGIYGNGLHYARTNYNGVWGAWVQIGGDTGWVNVSTFESGFSNAATAPIPFGYRILGGREVWLRGRVQTPSLAVNTSYSVATLPAAARPPENNNMNFVASTGGFVGWSNVETTGVVSIHFKSPWPATSTAIVDMTGIKYLLA